MNGCNIDQDGTDRWRSELWQGEWRGEIEVSMSFITDMPILRTSLDNQVEMLSKQSVNEFISQGISQN